MHFQINHPNAFIIRDFSNTAALDGILAGDENVIAFKVSKRIMLKTEMIPRSSVEGLRSCALSMSKKRPGAAIPAAAQHLASFSAIRCERSSISRRCGTQLHCLSDLTCCGKSWRSARDGFLGGVQNDGVYAVESRRWLTQWTGGEHPTVTQAAGSNNGKLDVAGEVNMLQTVVADNHIDFRMLGQQHFCRTDTVTAHCDGAVG